MLGKTQKAPPSIAPAERIGAFYSWMVGLLALHRKLLDFDFKLPDLDVPLAYRLLELFVFVAQGFERRLELHSQ